MSKVISVDLYADFGLLKKPDTNDPMYFTFNMLHKPAFLGILGAIIGEKGFFDDSKLSKTEGKGRNATTAYQRGVKPNYYAKLEHLKIAIQPLNSNRGIFIKDALKYNNGTGFASDELGGNLIVTEQFLIKPAYRCFIMFEKMDDTEEKLFDNLKNSWAEFLPYLGKNDFSLWWQNFEEYELKLFNTDRETSFMIDSVFIKDRPVKDGKEKVMRFKPSGNLDNSKFMYFENLPVSYNPTLWQYNYEGFAYTNFSLKAEYEVKDLFIVSSISKPDNEKIVQFF
jgi:CRISPR-associated protein Cas5h